MTLKRALYCPKCQWYVYTAEVIHALCGSWLVQMSPAQALKIENAKVRREKDE